MALDIEGWDERILKDYDHIMSTFHRRWVNGRDVMNNENKGSRIGNMTKEFAGAVRSRLINQNFFVDVSADDPDFAKGAHTMTVMANSVSRSIDLKGNLDDATEDSLWAGTGWLEVGHSLDLHSFDAMRTILHRNSNSFDLTELEDEYIPVPEDQVQAALGNDIGDVAPFDPFSPPPEQEDPSQPSLTFDPNVGSPWIKNVSPFFIVLPKETKKYEESDYVTKLVLLSKQELELITEQDIPDDVSIDLGRFQLLVDETPGGEFINDPIVIAVTFIRRDRNDPRYTGWYMAHAIGNPDVLLKSAPNPYGGMISLIPAKSRASMKILSKTWIEDLAPYTNIKAKVLEGIFKRIRAGMSYKWTTGSQASLDHTNSARINNPNYNGEIKFAGGSPEAFQYIEGPGLTQDHIQSVNLIDKLAQGEAGQTDIDRGTPIKKISARQTEALLNSSALMMEAIRGPIVEAGNQAILKIIHMLNLFSTPRGHIYKFGKNVVNIEPGGNDFTTSYQYKIEVKDLEGPANAETQLLIVQFLSKIAALPQFQQAYDWMELANEARRAFGFGVEVMSQPQVAGIAGKSPISESAGGPGGDVLPFNGGDPHEARALGDQGTPDIANALGGMGNI